VITSRRQAACKEGYDSRGEARHMAAIFMGPISSTTGGRRLRQQPLSRLAWARRFRDMLARDGVVRALP